MVKDMTNIDFYNPNSGVKSIRLEEIEGRKLMLVQFNYANNFWKDLNWAPTYQELTFIFHHLDLAEKFNFEKVTDFSEVDTVSLYKIQWKERVSAAGCISSLQSDFYPSAKKYLSNLLIESRKSPKTMEEYDRANHIMQDIVRNRLKKIFAFVMREVPEMPLENLTPEEKELFNRLRMLYDSFLTNATQIR
jgi:hypothetical protein